MFTVLITELRIESWRSLHLIMLNCTGLRAGIVKHLLDFAVSIHPDFVVTQEFVLLEVICPDHLSALLFHVSRFRSVAIVCVLRFSDWLELGSTP